MKRPFYVEGIGGIRVKGARPFPGATICLHGGPGGNCGSLHPFFPAERLLGDWYFPDLPNHGRSDSTAGDWRPSACIARLEAFAETVDGPLRIAGLSWGANVALAWACAHPTRFDAFVGISGARDLQAIIAHQSKVIATLPPPMLERLERASHAVGKEREYLENINYVDTLDVWMRGNPGLERYREGTLDFIPNPVANAGYMEHWLVPELRAEVIHAQLQRLRDAGVRTLLIRGADDRMGDDLCSMAHGAEDTGAVCVTLPRAGHCPFVDQPDRFFALVSDFLQGS